MLMCYIHIHTVHVCKCIYTNVYSVATVVYAVVWGQTDVHTYRIVGIFGGVKFL